MRMKSVKKISTSVSSKHAEDSLLACDVCYDRFSAKGHQTPRILTSCGHTFCLKCLNGIFQHHRRLECPSCRIETKMYRVGDGPGSLPINFRIVQLLEVSEASYPSREDILRIACICETDEGLHNDPVVCANCEGDAPQMASWGCVDCSTLFCDDCNALHLKLKSFRSHKTLSCDDYRSQSAQKCSKHPNELIRFFCNDCDVMACEIGFSSYHSGHKVSSIEERANLEHEKTKKLAQSMNKLASLIESQLEGVALRAAESDQNVCELHGKVEREGFRLVTILNERMKAAHARIEELGAKCSSQWDGEKTYLETHLAGARKCLEAAQRVPTVSSAVAVCTLSEEVHMEAASLLGEFSSQYESSAEIAENDSATASDVSLQFHCAAATQLSIDDDLTLQVEGLLGTLFAVEEISRSGHSLIQVHPLTREAGGFIGSAETLIEPKGMAVRAFSPESGQPSELFVADYAQDRIQVFDANSGALLRSIGNGVGNSVGELIGPRSVLLQLTPTGEWLLYVSDTENNRIQVFDVDTGAHVRTLGAGLLKVPEGMALREFDAGSRQPALLYVVCSGEDTVKVLDTVSGQFMRSIGSGEPGPGQLRSPEGLALRLAPSRVGPRTGPRTGPGAGPAAQSLLYVSDLENDRVQVFDADTGAYVLTIGEGIVGDNAGNLRSPSDVALQPARATGEAAAAAVTPAMLYVADYFNDRVQVFDADTGEHLRVIGDGRGKEVGQLVSPEYVCLHPGANGSWLLFVSETSRVQVFEL